MTAPGTIYRVILRTTRGDERPIEPAEPFIDPDAAVAWARSKMADPRYASWSVDEIVRTARAAMSRGTVANGSR